MASRIVQYFADKLKTSKEYPITLTKAVYDEEGNRLDDTITQINNSLVKVHKGYVQTTSISPASGQSVALTDLPTTYTTIHAIIPYAIQPTAYFGAIAYCTNTNVTQKNMYIQTPSFATATDKFNVYYIIIYS